MDLIFILNGITFIWNEEKAKQNPIKHKGITFEKAVEAFFDPFLVVVDASRNYEARDAVIGMDKNNYLLFVVHLQQENDMIRIISARQATRQERKYYEN
ncbi:BrnT family toxin [Cyanobacterium aponinum AL20118]|uniref:BrnT family toxin n=1 Tax=Cyanobacterium aponinum AL20115 TaxID=3090662 RepID=A0AAF1C170_9CHRO|nr:BrnT family toxin [Cyanobacterium aponinum]WPF88342.1 BrnT family toxin [Cyanobacterium aponinum AL20115]